MFVVCDIVLMMIYIFYVFYYYSKQVGMHLSQSTFRWLWSGYMACKRQLVCKCGWEELLAMLQAIVLSNEQKASMQKEMLKRYVKCLTVTALPKQC